MTMDAANATLTLDVVAVLIIAAITPANASIQAYQVLTLPTKQ